MLRKIGWGFVAAGIVLSTGCVVLKVPSTYVQVDNSLVNVPAGNDVVDEIDLYGVYIGSDTYFDFVQAGDVTSRQETSSEGSTAVVVDSIIAYDVVLGTQYETVLVDPTPMSVPITAEVTNTVLFDQTTAAVMLSGLVKKLSKE